MADYTLNQMRNDSRILAYRLNINVSQIQVDTTYNKASQPSYKTALWTVFQQWGRRHTSISYEVMSQMTWAMAVTVEKMINGERPETRLHDTWMSTLDTMSNPPPYIFNAYGMAEPTMLKVLRARSAV